MADVSALVAAARETLTAHYGLYSTTLRERAQLQQAREAFAEAVLSAAQNAAPTSTVEPLQQHQQQHQQQQQWQQQ